MSKLVWDKTGERFYETGVKKGVLYPQVNGAYPKGVVWNGLTAVTESPSGAEATPLYADDMKYLNLYSAEEFAATVEAYTYPDEFAACDGSASLVPGVTAGQQTRQPFGLSYVTTIGNDAGTNGYKIHLIYGAVAAPTEKAYATINDSPEAITFSWELSTTPVAIADPETGAVVKVGDVELKPTSILTIDSTKVDPAKLATLEAKLYGSDSEEATLPSPYEVYQLLKAE